MTNEFRKWMSNSFLERSVYWNKRIIWKQMSSHIIKIYYLTWKDSSLLIRSDCLLLLLLYYYYYYYYYYIYWVLFLSMVSGMGLSPCHRCHPIFKSVPREREMEKLLKIGWQRWHGDNPPPWKVLLKMKTKKKNNMKAISSHIIEPKVRKWKSWWKRKCLDKNKT